MSELRTTHESSVTPDQIDHLGHMNVRFYAVNAHAGTDAVLAGLRAWGSRPHLVHDVYTRHHREQMLGTPLVVRSGVLSVDERSLRLHHELAAADTGVLAATFVHGISPVGPDGQRLPIDADVIAEAAPQVVPMPEYAATRTISLATDLVTSAPPLATVVDRRLQMRRERVVTADECDERGNYRIEMAPMLTWGGEPLEGQPSDMLSEGPNGELMGWAAMETRMQFDRLPRVGTRIQSFGASVAVLDKVTHRVHWTFDLDSGELVTAFEAISLAFDTRGRRPMRIPDAYRAREERRLQPDLAPRPTG